MWLSLLLSLEMKKKNEVKVISSAMSQHNQSKYEEKWVSLNENKTLYNIDNLRITKKLFKIFYYGGIKNASFVNEQVKTVRRKKIENWEFFSCDWKKYLINLPDENIINLGNILSFSIECQGNDWIYTSQIKNYC